MLNIDSACNWLEGVHVNKDEEEIKEAVREMWRNANPDMCYVDYSEME